MSEITTIGLDLAKHVFQVHGIDAQGTTVLRKRLRRGQVLAFFSRIPCCVVGLEAFATAHYWARELGALGHEVRLMPAQYVKAYIKRNKHDAADAEAICEAVLRPTMRFVPVKTAEQQATALLGPRVRRLAGVGAAAEFNRRENPAGRHHQARQPLSATAADQWGKRQSAAVEGDQSRSLG